SSWSPTRLGKYVRSQLPTLARRSTTSGGRGAKRSACTARRYRPRSGRLLGGGRGPPALHLLDDEGDELRLHAQREVADEAGGHRPRHLALDGARRAERAGVGDGDGHGAVVRRGRAGDHPVAAPAAPVALPVTVRAVGAVPPGAVGTVPPGTLGAGSAVGTVGPGAVSARPGTGVGGGGVV